MKIVLASASKQRQKLLQTVIDVFEVIPADIDEKAISADSFEKKALAIAQAKAEKVALQVNDAIIIAADSFIVYSSQIFEKPVSKEEAKEMLIKLSGNWVTEYTGCCILDQVHSTKALFCAQPRAKFRPLSLIEIERYVNNNPVTDWSGGFSPAYDEGVALISKLEGSLSGFTHGLPLEWVLKELGM